MRQRKRNRNGFSLQAREIGLRLLCKVYLLDPPFLPPISLSDGGGGGTDFAKKEGRGGKCSFRSVFFVPPAKRRNIFLYPFIAPGEGEELACCPERIFAASSASAGKKAVR